jgi:FkbM family methyltransferase
MASLIERVSKVQAAIGVANLLRLRLGLKVGAPGLRHRVAVRPATSDKTVFYQIFVDREYRCLDSLQSLDTILDCGANVGYSAAYLLSRFLQARLLAVEPDLQNFAQLRRNLAPYGQRASLLRGAVWNRRTKLQFDEATMGAGDEWGRQMKEGAGAVEAYDIPSLLAMSGFERISLLKIDIEGAEREVFSANADAWLPLVDNIVIELHGKEAEDIFHGAIAPYGFKVSSCDELTVCLGPVRG